MSLKYQIQHTTNHKQIVITKKKQFSSHQKLMNPREMLHTTCPLVSHLIDTESHYYCYCCISLQFVVPLVGSVLLVVSFAAASVIVGQTLIYPMCYLSIWPMFALKKNADRATMGIRLYVSYFLFSFLSYYFGIGTYFRFGCVNYVFLL